LHAYRDAAGLARRALAIWPDGTDPDGRITTLEGLADCAELCGELESAAATWTEAAQLRRSAGDFGRAGLAQRRLANTAELLGDFTRAITAREAAADAFAAAGSRGEAAAERLALAEQLKSAAHLTRALEHAEAAAEDAEAAERTDLKARALAVQGATRAAMGDGRHGVELARSGLELALAGQLTDTAGVSYYELAEALLYSADYAAAAEAYESGFELCRAHGVAELGQACLACLSVAVRFMGDWDRSLALCGDVLDDDAAPAEVRMVAVEESGLIAVLRGDRRRARGPLRSAAAFGRSHEVFGIEVGATWGPGGTGRPRRRRRGGSAHCSDHAAAVRSEGGLELRVACPALGRHVPRGAG
jgi:tetratricopeptide (TPR) repeat protein